MSDHYSTVTPAQAGVQSGKGLCFAALDSGLRRNDEVVTTLLGSLA